MPFILKHVFFPKRVIIVEAIIEVVYFAVYRAGTAAAGGPL